MKHDEYCWKMCGRRELENVTKRRYILLLFAADVLMSLQSITSQSKCSISLNFNQAMNKIPALLFEKQPMFEQ